MKVIVATDGSLDPAKAAGLAATLAGPEGEVLILTVVEIPRQLLEAIREASGIDDGTKLTNVNPANIEYATQGGDPVPKSGWIGDDAIIARYVEDQRSARTNSMAAAISEAGVRNVRTMCRDSENVVNEILKVAKEEGTDVLCIGTLGLGRFEGLMGSISTKLARRAPIPVLLVR